MAAIIFDFDGTVADSFDFIVELLADAAGQPQMDGKQRQQLRGRSMAAIGRQLGLSWWRLLRLFFSGRRQMGAAMDQVKPFAGMPEIVEKLQAEGHELFIVSSNTVKNIRDFLHKNDMQTHFLEIYGSVGLFGKAPALRRLLKEHQLEKADTVYIGDEVRDVQAAHAVGIRVVAVSWGFARLAGLEARQPTALAKDPADLMKILEEL